MVFHVDDYKRMMLFICSIFIVLFVFLYQFCGGHDRHPKEKIVLFFSKTFLLLLFSWPCRTLNHHHFTSCNIIKTITITSGVLTRMNVPLSGRTWQPRKQVSQSLCLLRDGYWFYTYLSTEWPPPIRPVANPTRLLLHLLLFTLLSMLHLGCASLLMDLIHSFLLI